MSQELFSTHEGRQQLYTLWLTHVQFSKCTGLNASSQGVECLCKWLRWCIKEGHWNPHTMSLPAYEQFMRLPFQVQKQQVAQTLSTLRKEHLLPTRAIRKDANTSRWTDRDRYCLWYIGHMHALRFDQLRRLLARATSSQRSEPLSYKRTWEIVQRWKKANFVVYDLTRYRRTGWISLTTKGLQFADLPFRAQKPSLLDHLYWINEVRMHLEEMYPTMQWVSERSLQEGKLMREAGQKRIHVPDGLLLIPEANGEQVCIDIEVQVSKPEWSKVKAVMIGDDLWTTDNHAMHYYVNKQSQRVVRNVYQQVMNSVGLTRPSIEIIDVENFS